MVVPGRIDLQRLAHPDLIVLGLAGAIDDGGGNGPEGSSSRTKERAERILTAKLLLS